MNDLTLQKEPVPVTDKDPPLFKRKAFILLWMGGLFSSFSISIFLFAEAWYVVQVLNLEASLGLVYMASSIPRLMFMAIGGVLADRMSRSKLMFLSDLSRALLLIGLVILLIQGEVSLWTLVVLALIFGALDAFFWPAQSSLLPSVVSKTQLTRANSIVQMTNQFSFITAPMLAGFVIEWGSYPLAFGITSVMLLIASLLVYFIHAAPAPLKPEENNGMIYSLLAGWRYVRQSAFLTAVLSVAIVLNLLIVGPLNMGLPLFVKSVLGGTTLDFSFLEGSLAAGMFIGSLAIGIANPQKKRGQIMLIAACVLALTFLLFSQTSVMWQSLAVVFFIGASMSTLNIPLHAVIQSIVEKDMIGRIMSLLAMASMGLIPVSYALTSLLLSLGLSIDVIMLGNAIPLLLLVLIVSWKVPEFRRTD